MRTNPLQEGEDDADMTKDKSKEKQRRLVIKWLLRYVNKSLNSKAKIMNCIKAQVGTQIRRHPMEIVLVFLS